MKTSDLILEEDRILSREMHDRRGRILYGIFGTLRLLPIFLYRLEALESLKLIPFSPILLGILCIDEALIHQSKLLHLKSTRHYRSLLAETIVEPRLSTTAGC